MASGDGPVAPLLPRATIDALKYYGIFRTWKEEGKRLGHTFLIPVVLFPEKRPIRSSIPATY